MSSTAEQRREQILSAAERLFRHYGFAKTTVADIARRAGIGVGTVYLDFSSKEGIAAALSVRSHRQVLLAMSQASSADASWASRLQEVFAARTLGLRQFAEAGAHGYDLVHCGCAAAEEAYRDYRTAEEAFLTDFLASAIAAKAFRDDDPARLARLLLRIHDCFSPELNDGPTAELERDLDQLHSLLMHGLEPRRGG